MRGKEWAPAYARARLELRVYQEVGRGLRRGSHPHPNLPPSRGKGEEGRGLVGGGELAWGLKGHFLIAAEDDAFASSYAEDEGAALLAGVSFS